MPYINEFASGESLWSLSDSQSVRDFQGTIRFQEGNVHHDPPPTLDAARGTDLIKRIITIDGSTVTKTVQNGYPGAEAALFNLGGNCYRPRQATPHTPGLYSWAQRNA